MPGTARSAGLGVLTAVAVLLMSLTAPGATAAPSEPDFGGVAIEPLAKYDGQKTCSPTVKDGTSALRSLVLSSYVTTGDSGIVRDCAIGGTSEHKEGRAWDWRVNAFDSNQDAAAKDLFAWLLASDSAGNTHAMARRLGIMYMIYNGHVWSSYNASAGWRPYTGSNPHTDHVHISLSWPGALKQVSYWGAGPALTPATPPTTPSTPATPSPISSPVPTASAAESSIAATWRQVGGLSGPLGAATGAVRPVRSGQAQDYQGGQVLWSAALGAHAVYGVIGQRYQALGGADSPLGLPTSSETAVAGGRGNTFQGGQVLWSPATGAHAVYGAIGQRYQALGGPGSPLGLPTTDEGPAGSGRSSAFQGGRIHWSGATGARAVTGPVLLHHLSHGGAAGPLGQPVGELEQVDAAVQLQRFEGGHVYVRSGQARHVRGAIRDHWLRLGGPTSSLGLPVRDEYAVTGGQRSDFERGSLVWTAATATVGPA